MLRYITSDGGLVLTPEQADFVFDLWCELDGMYQTAEAERQAAVENRRSDVDGLRAVVSQSEYDTSGLSDFDLLRFVLARKTIEESKSMILKAVEWKATYRFDNRSPSDLKPENLWSEIQHPGKIEFTYNRERMPCFIARPSRHDKHHRDLEKTNALSVYTMEQAIRMLHPSQDKVCVLFDTRKVSMKSFDLDFLKFTTVMLLLYYPNRLHRAFVYGCPAVMKVMWRAFSPMLPEETRSKFVFIDDVLKYFDTRCLPSDMGGDGSCVFLQDVDPRMTPGLVHIDSIASLRKEVHVVVKREDLTKKNRSKKDKAHIDVTAGSVIVVNNSCEHPISIMLKAEKNVVCQANVLPGQPRNLRCGVPGGYRCELLVSAGICVPSLDDAGTESTSLEPERSVSSTPGSPSVFDTAPNSDKPSVIKRLLLGHTRKKNGSNRSVSPTSTIFNSCFSGSNAGSSVDNDDTSSIYDEDAKRTADTSSEASNPQILTRQAKNFMLFAEVRVKNNTEL